MPMRRERPIALILAVFLCGMELLHAAHACARSPHGASPESVAPPDAAAHPDCGGHRRAAVCCDPAFHTAALRRADSAAGPAIPPVTPAGPPISIASSGPEEVPGPCDTESPPRRSGAPAYLVFRSLRL
jgi:hypothetical protein